MSLDIFFQQYNTFRSLSTAASDSARQYEQSLRQAQAQPVCTVAFGTTLQNLTQVSDTYKQNYNQLLEQAQDIRNSFAGLSASDQNNNGVQSAMSEVTNGLNNASSTRNRVLSLNPSIAELQSQYESCPSLQDPAGSRSQDAGDTSQRTSQNQQRDDQSTSQTTSPTVPGPQGQKATANTSDPTKENTNIVNELLTVNPLSKFSSYTYNITLYMVTPEAYNLWLDNMVMPREGCYIVAKSGGFSKSDPRALPLGGTLNTADKATGPGYDYYIDDLRINSVYPTKSNMQSSVVVTDLTFKVYEPHGFGFLQRVARATAEITKLSNILKSKKEPPMPFQMLYLLEIKFVGYDSNGAVMPPAITKGPMQDTDNLQRVFPLLVANVKTKLDGRVTVYDWSATVPNERLGLGQIYGKLNSKISYEARTVGEAIGNLQQGNTNSLIGALNEEQRMLSGPDSKRQIYRAKYDVQYEKDSRIPGSELIDDVDVYKPNAAMAGAKRVEEVNPKIANKAVTFNVKTKKGEIPQGMSIVNVIDQLIYKSTYVSDALNKVNNERLETTTTDKPSRVELEWFVVLPKVKISEWDEQKNFWTVNITYQIKSYKIPFIRTQYADRKSLYYGPLKRYFYWFTGQNTEIISYEQTFDSLYYILQPYSTNTDNAARGKGEGRVPTIPDSSSGSSSPVGKANSGGKINESVKYSLYSPGDQATATINILGDPDFLMETIGGSIDFARGSSSYLFSQFYGKRGSINPYGGQIYIEIVFKTAEDYNNQTGLMEFNPNLIFYGNFEQQKIIRSQGVVYLITNIESVMRRGQFTQQLNLVIVPPDQLIAKPGQVPGAAPTNARQNPDNSADEVERLQRRKPAQDTRQPTVDPDYVPSYRENTIEPVMALNTNTRPLVQSPILTTTASGRPVVNDDASVNNGGIVVADSGRDSDTALG